jgi:hypothetical protein
LGHFFIKIGINTERGGILIENYGTTFFFVWPTHFSSLVCYYRRKLNRYCQQMKKIACLIVLSCILLSASSIADFPSTEISNGLLKLKLYLPDTANGYYRATRFDWAGVIPDLEYKGHHYFDNWNQSTYSPKLNDAIMGPVQEFGPLGYNEVKTGESFVKIGVGGLKKIEERSYRYAFTYEIINPGKWTVKKKKDRVTYTHDLTDASGYSYQYTKVSSIIKRKASDGFAAYLKKYLVQKPSIPMYMTIIFL